MTLRYLPLVVLWLCAAIQYFWLTPLLERLPSDYAEETSFAATSSFRERPDGTFQHSILTARRVDQTLVSSATHSIIQGDIHWTNSEGIVEFENTGIYGVDRHTKKNLPGYGDTARTGPFLFPLHTEPKSVQYWDPLYVGSRQATFDRAEILDGLPVYVFHFTAQNMDETAGYSHLPDVPERYRVRTDGAGWMWIEPSSGTMVDYAEQGISQFVDPVTGKPIADLYHWADRYTPETKSFKIKQAKAARLRIGILEMWLPLALFAAGLLTLLIGWKTRNHPDTQANSRLSAVAGDQS